MHALKWLGKEIIEMLPALVFFLITFNLVVFTDKLTTERYHVTVFTYWAATIAALIMAKVILLTDLLPFMNIFGSRPLIYNAIWKTALYFLVNLGLKYLELLIRFHIQYGSFSGANTQISEAFSMPRFWAAQVWFAVLLLAFNCIQELADSLGNHKLRQLFFGR